MLDCVSGRRRIPPRDTSLSTAATTKLGDLTTSEHGAFSAAGGQQPAQSEFQAGGRAARLRLSGRPTTAEHRHSDARQCQSPANRWSPEVLLEGRERRTKGVVSQSGTAALIVDECVGAPSTVSSLNMNPDIRSALRRVGPDGCARSNLVPLSVPNWT